LLTLKGAADTTESASHTAIWEGFKHATEAPELAERMQVLEREDESPKHEKETPSTGVAEVVRAGKSAASRWMPACRCLFSHRRPFRIQLEHGKKLSRCLRSCRS